MQTLAVSRRTAESDDPPDSRGTTNRLISTNPQLVARAMFQQAEKRLPEAAAPGPLQKGDLVRTKAGRAGHGDYGGVSRQTDGALSPGGRHGLDRRGIPAG